MKAFILSPEVERDLDGIGNYLLEEDLTGEFVKFWSVFSYLIVYDPSKKPVQIARVLHGKRDAERF